METLAKRGIKFVIAAFVAAVLLPVAVFAARTNIDWVNLSGTSYVQPNFPAGIDILIYGSNHYVNFGTVTGSSGYGFRDNGGTMEFKDSGGSWASFGSGGGGSSSWATTTAAYWYNTTKDWKIQNGALTPTTTLGLLINASSTIVGTTTSIFYDRGGAIFNARSYGVTANGTTDDCPAIQVAINAASTAGGGNVLLPPGRIKCNTRVTPKNKVSVFGAGIGVTIITGTVVSDWAFYYSSATTPIENFWLNNMTFDLNFTSNGSGVQLSNASSTGLRNVEFRNGAAGGWFLVYGASDASTDGVVNTNNLVEDVTFDNHAGSLEAFLVYNARDTRIVRPTLKRITSPGIGLWQKAYDTKIENLHCEDSTGIVVYYSITTDRTIITNPTVNNCARVIQGANISDWGTFGLTQAEGIYISNPVFTGGVNGSTTAAIQLGAVNNAKIEGGSISGYQIPILLDDGNNYASSSPTNWYIGGGIKLFDNNPEDTNHVIHPGIFIATNLNSCMNGIIDDVQIYNSTTSVKQRYPIAFNGAATYDCIQIKGSRLSAATTTGGTSIALADGAALGPNVEIFDNTDFSGTSPSQTYSKWRLFGDYVYQALTGGRLGIGTSTPNAFVDIPATTTTNGIALVHIGDSWTNDSQTKLLVESKWGAAGGFAFVVRRDSSNPWLVVDGTGFVGVATTTPGSSLSVAGNMTIGANYGGAGPTNGLAVQGRIGQATTSPDSAVSLLGYDTGRALLHVGDSTNNSSNKVLIENGWSGAGGYGLIVQRNAATPQFVVDGNGNVGLGTSTPGTSLSVQGVANFGTATSSFYGTGGINIPAGCFAVAGTCVGTGTGVSGGTNGMLTAWTGATSLTATSGPTATYFYATSTSATTTLKGGLIVGTTSDALVYDLSSGKIGFGIANPTSNYQFYSNQGSTSPLTYPFFKVHVDNSAWNNWAFNIENDGIMTLAELNQNAALNYHENGLSVVSNVDQSTIQQGFVIFWQKGASSTDDLFELSNDGLGKSIYINSNNDSYGAFALKDFSNKNHTKGNYWGDWDARVSDGVTYAASGANMFLRNKVTETSGSFTDSRKVLDARQENTAGTGDTVYSEQRGTGDAVSILNTSTGKGVYVNQDGNGESVYVDSEATSIVPFYLDVQNTSNSSFYILDQGVHGTGTFGSLMRLQMNNSSSTAPVIRMDNNGSGNGIDIDMDSQVAGAVNGLYVDVQNTGVGGTANAAIFVSGNVGVGTTTPGSLFSLGSLANFTTATSSFYGTGGINLTSGCFAVGGTCITGGSSSGFSTTSTDYWATTKNFASTTLITICPASLGRTCDFTTDGTNDNVEIQAAFNLASTTGRAVRAANGTYVIAAAVTINNSGFSLIGEGASTTFKAGVGFNDYVFKVNGTGSQFRSNMTFMNFKIDGDLLDQTSGGCMVASSTAASHFENVWFTACYGEAMKLGGTNGGTFAGNNEFINVRMDGGGKTGYYMQTNDENHIIGGTISNMTVYAINDNSGVNTVEGQTYVGNKVDWYVQSTSLTKFVGNTHDGTKGQVLKCSSANDLSVSGDQVSKTSTTDGLPVYDLSGCARTNFGGGNDISGAANYPYAIKESNSSSVTSVGSGSYYAAGTSSLPFDLTGTYSASLFASADNIGPSGAVWAQVVPSGNLHFNVPTGKSTVFSVNNATSSFFNSSGLTTVGAYTLEDAVTATKAFKFDTSGASIDLKSGGADVYLSAYDDAALTTDQKTWAHINTADAYVDFYKNFIFQDAVSGNAMFSVRPDNTEVVFNDGSTAINFRAEGDTDANLFTIKGSSDRIGVSSSTPWAKIALVATAGQTNPVFEIASSSPETSYFKVDYNGNIGLATSTPGAKLSIAGGPTSTIPYFLVSSTTATGALASIFTIDQNGVTRIGKAGTANTTANSLVVQSPNNGTTDQFVNFVTSNNSTVMVMRSDQRVGIAGNPGGTFGVSGSASFGSTFIGTGAPTNSVIIQHLLGVGTTTPVAVFQAAASSTNATTTLEFGKSGQTKGTCFKAYRTDGTAYYFYVIAGATAFTISTTANVCSQIVGF